MINGQDCIGYSYSYTYGETSNRRNWSFYKNPHWCPYTFWMTSPVLYGQGSAVWCWLRSGVYYNIFHKSNISRGVTVHVNVISFWVTATLLVVLYDQDRVGREEILADVGSRAPAVVQCPKLRPDHPDPALDVLQRGLSHRDRQHEPEPAVDAPGLAVVPEE